MGQKAANVVWNCLTVFARLVGRGFRFPVDSKLQTWNLADHQALPSLVFLPSSICSGSSNVTPASVVLLSTSLSALPPPLVSPPPSFTQLMPRYTGMHACTHPLSIPALPHLWLFPDIKQQRIFNLFLFRLFGWDPYVISSSGFEIILSKSAKIPLYDFCSLRLTFSRNSNSGHVNLPSCRFATFISSPMFLMSEVKFFCFRSACCLLGIYFYTYPENVPSPCSKAFWSGWLFFFYGT